MRSHSAAEKKAEHLSGAAFQANFGRIESFLAEIHNIAPSKRTAFQSRLKNFIRLGWPTGMATTKGKAAIFDASQYVQMALAIELTQLGLTPERVIRVLGKNWYPVAMCIQMAARALSDAPGGFRKDNTPSETDPLAMYLFFDPCALSSLTIEWNDPIAEAEDVATLDFFYGGQGVVRDNIIKWTSGGVSRISLVNITALLDDLGGEVTDDHAADLSRRKSFFLEVLSWAEKLEAEYYVQAVQSSPDLLPSSGTLAGPGGPARVEAGLREAVRHIQQERQPYADNSKA